MIARAPGKLIISGEHAVVCGRPALVTAIDRYVDVRIDADAGGRIVCELPAPGETFDFAPDDLQAFHQDRSARHQRFLNGDLDIGDLQDLPGELVPFAVMHALAGDPEPLRAGIRLRLSATLPFGCGLGASAAAAVTVLDAVRRYINDPLPRAELYRLGIECEHLQHGHSSGIDVFASVYGGLTRHCRGQVPTELQAFTRPLHLINTGVPESTTGDCVIAVQDRFDTDHTIWDEFEAVTAAVVAALESDGDGLRDAVRENHRLLQRIGVVPERVSRLIEDIETEGGAAKICGAGAVRGDNAGVVLAVDEVPPTLCRAHGVQLEAAKAETGGIRQAQSE